MNSKKVTVTGNNNNVFVGIEASQIAINTEGELGIKVNLNPKQQKIYDGLTLIGDEISTFYLDGVRLCYSPNMPLTTKGYFLAHLANEIDAGLKDIFLSTISETTEITSDRKDTHLSILNFLKIPQDSKFANDWFNIIHRLSVYAKRAGAYRQPRKADEVIVLWEEYESLLYMLVGNHYTMRARVKNLLQNETPSEEILCTLTNLFKDEHLKLTFYRELISLNWISPLYEYGFLNPKNIDNEYPTPNKEGYTTTPVWYEGWYIENMAKQNALNFDDAISMSLVKIIDDYIEAKITHNIVNRNANNHISIVILYLPVKNISDKHLEFLFSNIQKDHFHIPYDLIKHGFKNFIQQNAKTIILKALKFLLTPIRKESVEKLFGSQVEYEIPVYDNWLIRDLKEMIPELVKICGIEILTLLENIILSFSPKERYVFDALNIENVNFTEEEPYTRKSLYAIVNTTTRCFLEINETDKEVLLQKWIDSKIFIFQRIALYVIGKNFDKYKLLFFKKRSNPFSQHELNIEMAQLIRENITQFSDKEIAKMVRWIEAIDKKLRYVHETEEERVKYNAYEIRRRLTLLKPTNNPIVLTKIQEYEQLDNSPLKPNDSFKAIEFSMRSGVTYPINSEQIKDKTIDDLTEYIRNFNETDDFKRINYEGLGEVLKKELLNDPNKYFPHLNRFQDLDSVIVYHIIDSVSKILESSHFDYWKEFLIFYTNTLNSEKFWQNRWSVSAINSFGWMVNRLLKSKSDKLPISMMPFIKDIIFLSFQKVQAQKPFYSDEMMVGNDPYCVILSTFMEYAVRQSRLGNFEDKAIKWEDNSKNKLTTILKDTPSVQAYAVAGAYLPQLHYLDPKWVKDNIDLILPIDNDLYWNSCFSMYLLFHNQTCLNLFNLLKEKGHYIKAINMSDLRKEVKKKAIGYICLEFDTNPETLNTEQSLMTYLLNQKNPVNLTEIIEIYWRWGRKTKQADKNIKKLWKAIFEICQENIEQIEFKKVAGELCKWIPLLEKIKDKSFERIRFSLQYLETPFFIFEDLFGQVDKTPEKVEKLLIEYIKYQDANTYHYTPDELISIVRYLYLNNHKDMADNICDAFGKKGYSLGDIHSEFNSF